MKYMIIYILFLFTACSSMNNSEVKEFIPGTYTRFSQHEYGEEHDTLIITLQNKSANEYKILRKWKYERILDRKKKEPEYKKIITSAIFNEDSKLLHETETGDGYSFDAKQNLVFAGSTKYKKLK